jgi:hypothetical protein
VRFRHRRWSPSRSWALWRPLPVAAACVLVLTLGWVPAGLAASAGAPARQVEVDEEGVDGNEYESPTFGYTLEWDEDVWEVVEATSTQERDRLHLRSDGSDLLVDGLSDFDGDTVDCLADRIANLENRALDIEPFEDEDGDDVEGEEDGRAFAAFLVTGPVLEDDDETDEDAELIAYLECRTLVEGDAVIQILHVAPVADYPDEALLAAEALETLTIPAADEGDDGEGEDEEVGEDEEPTEEATEEATEEPEEEATEEATEEPEDEEEDEEQTPEEAGVDDDTYTSPTFGYSLEWDEDEWEVEDATSEDDVDTLVLSNGVSTLTITGLEDFDGDLADCLEETAAELEDGRDVESFEPALNADGDPIEIDDDDRVGAVYLATVDGDEVAYQVECRTLVEDEAVIQIVQVVPADDFDDEIAPVAEVLDTLTLEGEEPEEEEEEETPEPEEEEEETPDPEDELAEAGVDGNSYVSPQFGYSLEWDPDVWQVDGASSDLGFDDLGLLGQRSFLEISGTDGFADAFVCFDNVVSFFSEDSEAFTVEDFEPFEDEDGEVVEGEEDDRVFGAFLATLVEENGFENEIVYYVECRTLVEGESVIVIIQIVDPQAYDAEAERRDEVLDTIELPDVDAGDEEDEEQDPDEEEDTGGDEDADQDEDEDDDDGRDTADEPDEADLRTYTSDLFGYSLAWDRDFWTLTDRQVEDDRDYIELSADSGFVTIEGQTRFAGDPAACLNTVTTNLRAIDGVEGWTRVDDSSLLPEGRGRGGAVAMFSFTLAPEGRTPTAYYAYVECRVVVPDQVVLAIVYTVPAVDYETERDALSAILEAIELPE